jgi:hypothetical protein
VELALKVLTQGIIVNYAPGSVGMCDNTTQLSKKEQHNCSAINRSSWFPAIVLNKTTTCLR